MTSSHLTGSIRTTLVLLSVGLLLVTLLINSAVLGDPASPAMLQRLLANMKPSKDSWGCINFTPYVHGYNPDYGPHPPPELIDELLNILVEQTNFRCIQTYGVLNNLTYTFEAAKKRNLKVIAVIWLEPEVATDGTLTTTNSPSIELGIEMAKKYVDTIIGISCGSEMRVRNPLAIANPPILHCIEQVKAAKVEQPLTSNDYYWFWCDAATPCRPWSAVANLVDYVAINAFPWWENKHAPQCVPATAAPQMHLDMYNQVVNTYPGKPVIISEYGWPGGPQGYSEINEFTNQPCTGVASESNQNYVMEQSMIQFKQHDVHAIAFCAFRETWKVEEGDMAAYWGICTNAPPYKCKCLFDYNGMPSTVPDSYNGNSTWWGEIPAHSESSGLPPTLSTNPTTSSPAVSSSSDTKPQVSSEESSKHGGTIEPHVSTSTAHRKEVKTLLVSLFVAFVSFIYHLF